LATTVPREYGVFLTCSEQYVQYFEGVATVGVSDVTAQATQETTLIDSASLIIKEKATQAKALFDGATGNGIFPFLRVTRSSVH
jgi:hypothetical protein